MILANAAQIASFKALKKASANLKLATKLEKAHFVAGAGWNDEAALAAWRDASHAWMVEMRDAGFVMLGRNLHVR